MTPVVVFGDPGRMHLREREKWLASELHRAQEQQRLLKLQIREREGNGDLNSSDDLAMVELRARYSEAKQAHEIALGRFIEFATKGIVPTNVSC